MAMKDDVDRLAKSYEWWPAEKAGPMLLELTAALEKHPKGRFCLRRGLRDDGQRVTWLEVVDREGTSIVAFDDSFGCPPIC